MDYTPQEVLEENQPKVTIGEKLTFQDYPERAMFGLNELKSGFEKAKNQLLDFGVSKNLISKEKADSLRFLTRAETIPGTNTPAPDQYLVRSEIMYKQKDERGRSPLDIVNELMSSATPENGLEVEKEEKMAGAEILDYLKKAEDLANVVKQSLENQRDVVLESPEFGKVGCRVAEIMATSKNKEIKPEDDEPLIFYIGGYSTDIESIIPMLLELPLSGRDVIGAGYPDSQAGTVSQKFLDKVKESDSLEAHAKFYKEVVREFRKKYPGRKIELMGQSTGALIVADMLSDISFSDEVDRATIIGSAGSTEMSKSRQRREFVKEGSAMPKDRWLSYSSVWGMNDRTGLDNDPVTMKMQKDLRGKVSSEVTSRTNRSQRSYDSMRVKPGGKILIVTGGKDNVTKDYERFNEKTIVGHDQWELLHVPEGRHQDTNTYADIITKKILTKWGEIKSQFFAKQ
jgi:hypothetical protein